MVAAVLRSIATVTGANVNKALTTLERVKAELGIAGSASDTVLQAKILEASSDIEAHLGRTLRQETLSEVFWGLRGEVGELVLARYPVASVVSVTVDDEPVDLAEIRIDGAAGLLYRLTEAGLPACWRFGKSLTVVNVAGYRMPGEAGTDLPPALQAACIELVTSYWSARGRDPLLRAEDVPGVGRAEYWVGAVGAAGTLPASVLSKIEPFRRPVIA